MNPNLNSHLTPYLFAIASNLCFGTASIRFSYYAARFSPGWMNQFKVTVALIGFLIAFLFLESFVPLSSTGWFALLGSGMIGLFLGDWFLFQAFAHLGATRTLVLYSFQPFLLGLYGFLFLGQILNGFQVLAILFMIACVFTFVLERNRQVGHFDLKHFFYAFLGILFDAMGVVLSREAYEQFPSLGSFQANATRAFGALLAFMILKPSSVFIIRNDLKTLSNRESFDLLGAVLLGTFLSLAFYLHALKTAHVASLTAISITGPIWVSLIEHLRERKLPNAYFVLAFVFFLVGFYCLYRGI